MGKRIIICSDGTWNRPETKGEEIYPTNVIKFARGIAPKGLDGKKQIVFYDWGIGSYHDKLGGGMFAKGLEKNVMDAYRFIVHNYEAGDELFFFGFSRGAYTVRSLSGLLNNCHVLKSTKGQLIEKAFKLYKDPSKKANGPDSKQWREENSLPNSGIVHFIGVWDTVGSVGVPFSIFGFIEDKHVFYDNKLGSNVKVARHALSLDEERNDFEPTIWQPRSGVNIKQVWFAGVHSDVGGGYEKDVNGVLLSDIPMNWMMKEAKRFKMKFDDTIDLGALHPLAEKHNEYKRLYYLRGKHKRTIPKKDEVPTLVHYSVKERYEQSAYRSFGIEKYVSDFGEWPDIETD
ncbi:MAG: DUF2235 domain-containing protein [Vicingaceae bacterium]